jgi:prepilin-type N-terminal cleavage/methylation domain-containing protein
MTQISTREMTDRRGERGFSLMEVMVAMSILLIGLLGLAQVFYLGMANASTSSAHLIAREKAREAIESVHTARDTHTIAWNQIHNVAPPACAGVVAAPPQPAVAFTATGGGIFLNGEQELRQAGADGLVNTGDDAAAGYEELPGPNGRYEAAAPTDDVRLDQYWREVAICDVNPDLRQIQVTVRYRVGTTSRRYTLSTYISSFS